VVDLSIGSAVLTNPEIDFDAAGARTPEIHVEAGAIGDLARDREAQAAAAFAARS
jgi:hypothetical protein